MPRLSLGLGVQSIRKVGGGGPAIPQSGLSLWLRADAGVTIPTSGPYTYASQIVITGSNTPNVNGTYNASSVPTFDFEGMPNPYFLNGPTYAVEWTNPTFYLDVSQIGAGASWTSSNGTSWTIAESRPDTITISGSETPNVNGVYTNPDFGNVFYGPTYVIENYSGFQLLDQGEGITYYTASSATGPWTIVDGVGAITSSVTSLPRGSITATKIVSSSVATAWADQSGNGNNATATDAPTLTTVSGKKFMDFAGGYFTGNELITSPYATIMCVARFSSTRDIEMIFAQISGETNSVLLYRGFDLDSGYRIYNGVNLNSSSLTNNNQTYLFGGTFSGASGALYLNGTADGTGDCGELTPAGAYYLGYWGGDNSVTTIELQMAEIVVYNRVLTTPERQQVQTYLNSKYAIY
jgi:hypothetical protein